MRFAKSVFTWKVSLEKLVNRRKRLEEKTRRIAEAEGVYAELLSDYSQREVHSILWEDITTDIRRRICSLWLFDRLQPDIGDQSIQVTFSIINPTLMVHQSAFLDDW
jgi:hypothetical protein